jgi:hypothetical protein
VVVSCIRTELRDARCDMSSTQGQGYDEYSQYGTADAYGQSIPHSQFRVYVGSESGVAPAFLQSLGSSPR